MGWGWALIWVWLGGRRGGRLFEAGRLLTFSAFRMGAYSRWALIRGWALIRINTVFKTIATLRSTCFQRRVHPIGIDILLYNTVSDHLMLTCWKWSDERFFCCGWCYTITYLVFRNCHKSTKGLNAAFVLLVTAVISWNKHLSTLFLRTVLKLTPGELNGNLQYPKGLIKVSFKVNKAQFRRRTNNFDSDVVPESNQIQDLLMPRNNSPPNSPWEHNLAKILLSAAEARRLNRCRARAV